MRACLKPKKGLRRVLINLTGLDGNRQHYLCACNSLFRYLKYMVTFWFFYQYRYRLVLLKIFAAFSFLARCVCKSKVIRHQGESRVFLACMSRFVVSNQQQNPQFNESCLFLWLGLCLQECIPVCVTALCGLLLLLLLLLASFVVVLKVKINK